MQSSWENSFCAAFLIHLFLCKSYQITSEHHWCFNDNFYPRGLHKQKHLATKRFVDTIELKKKTFGGHVWGKKVGNVVLF